MTPTEKTDFWGEMSACEHFVQIYERDADFLDRLAEFTAAGIGEDHAAIIIATAEHRRGLSERLTRRGFDIKKEQSNGRLHYFDAAETIEKFMVKGWPDRELFRWTVGDILAEARKNNRKVRAFGEMVALMWEKGHTAAVIRLEQLWTELCSEAAFPLFCAYPKPLFAEAGTDAIGHVCALHSKVLED